jgi:hypothetical protein
MDIESVPALPGESHLKDGAAVSVGVPNKRDLHDMPDVNYKTFTHFLYHDSGAAPVGDKRVDLQKIPQKFINLSRLTSPLRIKIQTSLLTGFITNRPPAKAFLAMQQTGICIFL